jgi:hypothetical protein
MESGFHSLIQVLLEVGAPPHEGTYDALEHAISLRRPDLAALLIQHGAQVDDVSMRFVIEMWQPEIVDLFLANGASLVRGNPIAWGLIHKIRPTLGLLKRFAPEQPELMRQADIALRFHAGDGNAKWVALMLWAGADPWTRGPDRLDDADDEDADEDGEHANAVELAITRGNLEVLRQKKLLTAPDVARPETLRILEEACHAPDSQALSLLLERGYSPELLPDHGTAAITSLLHSMSWDFSFPLPGAWSDTRSPNGIDSTRARERMKMLHMIVARGAKWLPADKRAIGDARRSLLKMAPDYVLEFVWLMREHAAARRRDVQELLRTPSMARLLSKDRERVASLVAGIPEELFGSGQEERLPDHGQTGSSVELRQGTMRV